MGEIINPYKKGDNSVSSLDLIHYVTSLSPEERKNRRRNLEELYSRAIAKLWAYPIISKFGSGYREIDPKEICGCLKTLKDAYDDGNKFLENEHFVPLVSTINYVSKLGFKHQKNIIINWDLYKMLREAAKEVSDAGN
ncbi:MAG: hypothetical protein WC091_02630 [Sulfuricellaceae bacterium]